MHDDEYTDEEWEERVEMFADPGGNSALRAASASNPRNLDCPTCGAKNVLMDVGMSSTKIVVAKKCAGRLRHSTRLSPTLPS